MRHRSSITCGPQSWPMLILLMCCHTVFTHFTSDDYFRQLDESENLIEDGGGGGSDLRRKYDLLRTTLTEGNRSTIFSLLSQHHSHEHEWNFTQVNLANSHLFFIRTKYSCSLPRAKLIKVLDYHSSPSKQYVPRCTVLHRCDDESGCCEDVTHRCEPGKTELVDLYFHVIRSDLKNNITGGSAVGIERLTFLNHTQCECKPINYMPRSSIARPPIRTVTANTGSKRTNDGYQKCKHVINCAEPFIQRFREVDQRCVCDCALSHPIVNTELYRQCLDIQNGTAKFKHFWARCVRMGECAEPICAFGFRYSKIESKCTLSSQMEHKLRHHNRRHHHHHHPARKPTELDLWMRHQG